MIPQETDRRPSLYDNIPVLDLWYQTPIASPAASSPLPDRKTTCSSSRPVSEEGRRSVSFSTDPPSVHYIPDQVFDDELDTDSDRTHNHRRVSTRMRSLARRLLRRPNKIGVGGAM
ncbi:hypothetical protein VTP01DRAFT_3085 [Rhizomucor pusillus]|uniref:uncharacterized protein n=1 Tax=Rhizomucor pusillus TaxID=4840 RepID=UPI003741F0BB